MMARFRYLGGDQRPDVFGVLQVGDVLELSEQPDWGDWESSTKKVTGASPTPQPAYIPAGPEADADDPAASPPPTGPDTAKES